MQDKDSIYTAADPSKKPLFIVIAGDRGLAGGYNSNVFKLADPEIEKRNGMVIAIGKKSVEHYERVNCQIVGRYSGIAEDLDSIVVSEISEKANNLFRRGKIGSVHLVFTQFVTPLTQIATEMRILPLELHVEKRDPKKIEPMVLYEPSAEAVFNSIIPQYIAGMVYGGIVESYASEQGARRTAMESATNNARDMIDSLSLSYNRARQSAITQELTEIVAGANAAS